MQIELRTPARGSTGPWRRKNVERITAAAAKATDRAAIGARDELRAAMRAQRLGGLARAIGSTSDLRKRRPGGRGGAGLDVAGFITAKGRSGRTRGALEAYVENVTTEITPKGGRFLWIATPELKRTVGRGRQRRRLSPSTYKSGGLEQSIGPLRFVKGRNAGTAMLVVEDATISLSRTGRAKAVSKTGRTGKGRARVGFVAFVGIRRTRRSRRVTPQAIAQRWAQKLPGLLSQDLGRGR